MIQLILIVLLKYYCIWIMLQSPCFKQQYQVDHVIEILVYNIKVSGKWNCICNLFLLESFQSLIINGTALLCVFLFCSYSLFAPCEIFLPPGILTFLMTSKSFY